VRQIAAETVTVEAALLRPPQVIHHLPSYPLTTVPCSAQHHAIADIGRLCTGRAWHHSLKEGK
jgi:hypothetical protein